MWLIFKENITKQRIYTIIRLVYESHCPRLKQCLSQLLKHFKSNYKLFNFKIVLQISAELYFGAQCTGGNYTL